MSVKPEKAQPSLTLDNGRLSIHGCLCVNTVSGIREEGNRLLNSIDDAQVDIDLSGVDVNGTAVIALLISWKRDLDRKGRSVHFTGASETLIAIAEASGVSEVLSLS
ncbi:MAG: STAS domain-containing protein [Pseudomonadales bacterium]|nr:STAS domain-containing protein [Pseudomonadales bacterium]